MPLTPEQLAFERSLLPAPLHWGNTGVLKPHYDSRDYPAIWHPGIAEALSQPMAPDADLLHYVKEPRYNQGAEGSCTANATSGSATLDHSQADGSWPLYAAHQLYAEAGGSGNSGADPRVVLSIAVERGLPKPDGTREKVIKSYVALDRTPGVFRQEVKAAIIAGESVLIYSLLPIPFSWNSGTTLSSGYHEYVGIGYQTDAQGREWLVLMNSWGDGWPGDQPAGIPGGIGRILFDALEQAGGQSGYLGGFVPTSLLITPKSSFMRPPHTSSDRNPGTA